MITETFQRIIDIEEVYVAGREARAGLIGSGIVCFTGQTAGTGKDAIKEGCAAQMGGTTLRSATTRGSRPSDGNDYRYDSEEEFLQSILEQVFVEYAVLRKEYGYATDLREIMAITKEGGVPFKDLELKGLSKLRQIAGRDGLVKAIYPLPDLRIVEGDKTGWEKMLTDRDYEGATFKDVLMGELGDEKEKDLRERLVAARNQLDQVVAMGLTSQPGTFFPTNTYGNLQGAIDESVRLLTEVEDDPIARFSYGTNVKYKLLQLQELADTVLNDSAL